MLALGGLIGSAVLLAGPPEARRWPSQTIGQLAAVTAALAGPASIVVHRSLRTAPDVPRRKAGDGDPTPVWHVPLPMIVFAAFVGPVGKRLASRLPVPGRLGRKAGWDAALRVTGGSALVGLWQALVLSRLVGRAEQQRGRTAVRLPGSRLGATRIGFTRSAWAPRRAGGRSCGPAGR